MTSFRLDGVEVDAPFGDASLLDNLRALGRLSVKDGCSPQGQCGCCTVLVDDGPRVACVTPVRRVDGRTVVTVEGLDPAIRDRWARAFLDCGASQCGFCTPGILLRLVGLERRGRAGEPDAVRTALLAHLCRCTGWQTIVEAAGVATQAATSPPTPTPSAAPTSSPTPTPAPSPAPARAGDDASRHHPVLSSWRASLEGHAVQQLGTRQVLGGGGFADDRCPGDALAAVQSPDGWTLGATLADARRSAARPPGRRSTVPVRQPLEVAPGPWALVLSTAWVEPGYLEPDASWCSPGGRSATPLANGGAFGGKRSSAVPEIAAERAAKEGQAVRAVWSREDVIRWGPKRPPMAAGLLPDGSGLVRVGVTPGTEDAEVATWAASFRSVLPDVEIQPVQVPGPPVSADLRSAGWAEAQVLAAGLRAAGATGSVPGAEEPPAVRVTTPDGATAVVTVRSDPEAVEVEVSAGHPLDEVVLRSYVIGSVHQGLGWVWSEGIAVDDSGTPVDLTVRSLGILTAKQMPPVSVRLQPHEGPPVAASDAVFAATAAAAWIAEGLPASWPTRRAVAGSVRAGSSI